MTVEEPNGRLASKSINLQHYEFEIIHRKESLHANVDTLSSHVEPTKPSRRRRKKS
jgi:hypothetical protein